MLVCFLGLIIIFFKSISFNKGEDYLDIKQTHNINGIFIIIVFFSHFYSYYNCELEFLNELPIMIIRRFGQLMVAPFLFFSGYGIYYSIKRKKDYILNFSRKRLLKTWIHFALAILLYLFLNILINREYTWYETVLSFTGITSIGNSNWYMFAIFVCYILVLFLFNKKINEKIKDVGSIILIILLLIFYICLTNKYLGSWYADTILCFPLGMIYLMIREKLEQNQNNKKYVGMLIVSSILFILTYLLPYNVFVYNIKSMIFVFLIVLFSMKITIRSKILEFFGNNIFWIYILQRLPMTIVTEMNININLSFVICFVITVILSILMSNLTKKIIKL